jgi:small subunit ribosomal protein S2
MALPEFSMRQLLESGAHFGHRTQRWNPKMAPYIYGSRNSIHIMDLTQTVPLLHQALVALRDVVTGGGRVLFVGTKRQASEPIAAAAKRCAQYYVNQRWRGGTVPNWQTISISIKRLRNVEETLNSAAGSGLTKKELLGLLRERDKLERSLGGIKEMGGLPNILFVIDTNKEQIAVAEAKKLGIPVAAILDSNSDPDGIAYPVPGNDDAARALSLYCDLVARAIIDGLSEGQVAAGVDVGEAEDVHEPRILSGEPVEAPATV